MKKCLLLLLLLFYLNRNSQNLNNQGKNDNGNSLCISFIKALYSFMLEFKDDPNWTDTMDVYFYYYNFIAMLLFI
jgi:hypothetical protein